MPAKKLLDLLEKQGLLDPSIISDLRKQLAEATVHVTPEMIAKKLVDSGHLTKFQATNLVAKATEGEDDSPKKRKRRKKGDDEIVMLEDASASSQPKKSKKKQPQQPAAPAQPQQLDPLGGDPLGGGLEPLGGLDPLGGDPSGGLAGVDDMMGDPNAEQGNALGGTPKKKGLFGGRKKSSGGGYQKPKPRPDNVFDTKLMFIGSGALLLLLVFGGFLYYSLTRGTAQEMFNEAERDYNSESYSAAIEKYDTFLRQYPTDENASLARVRIGMSRIWQNENDPKNALEMAVKVLPSIEEEEAFDQAREELASVLPEIARKFAVRAESATDTAKQAENVQNAEQALELVNNPSYVPTSLRQQVQGKINQTTETLEEVNHVINRENDLVTALGEIAKASNDGDMPEVYRVRDTLLDKYPGLEANEQLQTQLMKVAEREMTLVEVSTAALESSNEPRSEAKPVVMANNSGATISGVDQEVLLVQVSGVVYGLNAKDGGLLWQRNVGPSESQPQRVNFEIDANVLVNDAANQEVVCLQPRTGELVWRTKIGEKFYGPRVSEDEQVLVTTESGAIYKLDAATGESIKMAKSPLPVRVPPTVKTRRPQFYQLADHTNIYVHAVADTDQDGEQHKALECREVFYLGHRAGSVATAPVMLLGHLFIAENQSPEVCALHILRVNDEGLTLRTAQPPILLRGRVVVEPVIANRRLVVTTDLGSVYVLDVDPSSETKPVTDAVEPLLIDRETPMISYASVDKAMLWIGDNRITRYNIQVAKSELSRRWVKLPGDVFQAPIQRIGNAVVHVRTPEGSAGAVVSAVSGDTGDPIWQTTIGAPAGTAFFAPDGSLRAVSAAGQLFSAGDNGLAKLLDASEAGSPSGAAFLDPVEFGNQLVLCSVSDRRRFVLVDKSSADTLKQLRMATSAPPTSAPVYAARGLSVGLSNGQVVLIDPATGENLVRPFMPTVSAGTKVHWYRPSPAGPDGSQIVIADDRNNIFRLGAEQDAAAPFLSQLSHRQLEQDIIAPAVNLGQYVFVGVRGVQPEPESSSAKKKGDEPEPIIGDEIQPLTLIGLRPRTPMTLEGRIVQGPYRVGEKVYLLSDREGLICLDAEPHQEDVYGPAPEEEDDGSMPAEASSPSEDVAEEEEKLVVVGTRDSFIRWMTPLEGRLAGPPKLDGDALLLAKYDGEILRVNPDDGKVISSKEMSLPIAAAPVVSADQVVLAGPDGTLRTVSRVDIGQTP